MRIPRPICLALFGALVAFAEGARTIDLNGIDRTVSPTADFYRFANGKWLDNVELPPGRPLIGTFAVVAERNQQILHEIAEEAAAGAPDKPRTDRDKVGLFYRVGMDEERADRLGVDPIKPELDRIEAITDTQGLVDELAALHRIGVRAGFNAGVSQDRKNSSSTLFELRRGGLGMANPGAYLSDDPRAVAIRTRYQGVLSKLLTLAGESDDRSRDEAKQVIGLEVRLAVSTGPPSRDPQASYHLESLAQLQTEEPSFDWKRFFKDLGRSDPGQINVPQPETLKVFDSVFAGEPLDTWKAYLKCQLLVTTGPLLSKPFAETVFSLTNGNAQAPPRWRTVLGVTNGMLGMALGKLYVEKTFPPEARDRAQKLVLDLKSELRNRIANLDWMGADTKKEALAKLDAMGVKVGYPDEWRDYSRLDVESDSFAQNVFRASELDFERALSRVGKSLDRRQFEVPPQVSDAFYVPTMNEIVIPAGILQPPFFDPKAPDAQNYGGIGCVIGHELTHGFDNNGRQYDAKGELRDWWSPEDARRFNDRADALVDQYGKFVVVDDVHVDGRLTLPENIADNGGVTIAFLAFKRATEATTQPNLAEFTPDQQFFLSYAQIWRQKVRPEVARNQARSDPHSPGRYRVIGVLANQPAFWHAWGAEPPGPMVAI